MNAPMMVNVFGLRRVACGDRSGPFRSDRSGPETPAVAPGLGTKERGVWAVEGGCVSSLGREDANKFNHLHVLSDLGVDPEVRDTSYFVHRMLRVCVGDSGCALVLYRGEVGKPLILPIGPIGRTISKGKVL